MPLPATLFPCLARARGDLPGVVVQKVGAPLGSVRQTIIHLDPVSTDPLSDRRRTYTDDLRTEAAQVSPVTSSKSVASTTNRRRRADSGVAPGAGEAEKARHVPSPESRLPVDNPHLARSASSPLDRLLAVSQACAGCGYVEGVAAVRDQDGLRERLRLAGGAEEQFVGLAGNPRLPAGHHPSTIDHSSIVGVCLPILDPCHGERERGLSDRPTSQPAFHLSEPACCLAGRGS